MTNKSSVVMSRKELYDHVWEKPVSHFAKENGLNYGRLLCILKENDIPYPSSGYWTKVSLKKEVSFEKKPLPGDPDSAVTLALAGSVAKRNSTKDATDDNSSPTAGISSYQTSNPREKKDAGFTKTSAASVQTTKEKEQLNDACTVQLRQLSFMEKEQRESLYNNYNFLQNKTDSGLHRVLIRYKSEVEKWKQQKGWPAARSSKSYQRSTSSSAPPFMEDMSMTSFPRTLDLLNRLFRIIEKSGGTVISPDTVQVLQDPVTIWIEETVDRKDHQLTKPEAKALVEYNDAKKRGHYAYLPSIPKYDYYYTGNLQIMIGNGPSVRIKDTRQAKLESQIWDILVKIYVESEHNRVEREKREEETRIREENRRKAEELREKINLEKRETLKLIHEAHDYALACEIRRYVEAKLSSCDHPPEELAKWAEWASEKANWIDPTLDAHDELLGHRNHGDSDLQKENALSDSHALRFNW